MYSGTFILFILNGMSLLCTKTFNKFRLLEGFNPSKHMINMSNNHIKVPMHVVAPPNRKFKRANESGPPETPTSNLFPFKEKFFSFKKLFTFSSIITSSALLSILRSLSPIDFYIDLFQLNLFYSISFFKQSKVRLTLSITSIFPFRIRRFMIFPFS